MKKIMKQVVAGLPGPIWVSISRDLWSTAALTATNIVNNIPYQQVPGNVRLLAPADFVTPWRTMPPQVRDLPESNLKTLSEAKRTMDIIQERMRGIVKEEIQTLVERFKQGKLKLGINLML